MKTHIYALFLLVNILAVSSVNAQKQFCYTNYVIDTIAYNPVLPYDVGTQVFYNVGIHENHFIYDSLSSVIPIGFNFNFYGKDYNSLLISPNGYLTFDTALAGALSPTCFYGGLFPFNSIGLIVQAMDPQVYGTIKYSTIGIAPNRQFVASYDSVAVYLATNNYGQDSVSISWGYNTEQVVLDETTSTIEVYIYSDSFSAAQSSCGFAGGIQNSTGTLYIYDVFGSGNSNESEKNAGRQFIQVNLPNPTPNPLCMVSVDSATGKNMVVWNKADSLAIDSFIVYKETDVAGVYAAIGEQCYSAFSNFIDTGSIPAQQANRYKLGFADSCGVIATQSAAHKTIHLSISQGIGNTWNLSWDDYEGFSFGSYYIYRGTSPTNMTSLKTIAGNLYSYTDLTPPVGTVYYAIGVVNPDPCAPARLASNNTYSSSLSNIVTSNVLGVPTLIDESSITVFPNPVNETTNVQFRLNAKTDLGLVMNDITGRVVYSAIYKDIANSFNQQIDCSNLSRGVYFLQIKTDGGNYNRKIVVE